MCASTRTWWSAWEQIDPISLEPLSALPYPPFVLRANVEQHSDSGDWFDPRALALYLGSSRRFTHPISRRALTRDECLALDGHLRRARIDSGISEVTRVFDALTARPTEPVTSESGAQARRTSELEVAEALFRAGGPVPSMAQRSRQAAVRSARPGRGSARAGAPRGGGRGRLHSDHAIIGERDGGMAIIDDDLVPTHARGRAALAPHQRPACGSLITAADYGEWPSHRARSPEERAAFPALPAAAARPIPQPLPAAVAAASAARAAARAAAAAAAAEEEAAAVAATAAARAEWRASRRQALLATILEEADAAGAAGEADAAADALAAALIAAAASKYSAEAVGLARSAPELVCEIERAMGRLVATGERRRALRPMPRAHRRLTHELAHLYHIGTVASGVEPHRLITLYRTDRSGWPECTLSEALTHLTAPPSASGQPLAPSPTAPAAGGAAGWPLRLVQVECDERVLRSLLSAHRGEYSIVWSPEARRERSAAREGMWLSATLSFPSEAVARAALQTVGGGMRGKFRVEKPPWAAAAHPPATAATAGAAVGGASWVTVEVGPRRVGVPNGAHLDDGGSRSCASGTDVRCVELRLRVGRPASSTASTLRPTDPTYPTAAASDGAGGRMRRGRSRRQTANDGAGAMAPPAGWECQGGEDEALVSQLVQMGFGEAASRRASLHVSSMSAAEVSRAAEGEEGRLALAIMWLTSEHGGAAEPLPVPPPVLPAALPLPPPSSQAAQVLARPSHRTAGPSKPAPLRSRWAALAGEADDSD